MSAPSDWKRTRVKNRSDGLRLAIMDERYLVLRREFDLLGKRPSSQDHLWSARAAFFSEERFCERFFLVCLPHCQSASPPKLTDWPYGGGSCIVLVWSDFHSELAESQMER